LNLSKYDFDPLYHKAENYKTDRHDITEILLKVALNTIKQTNKQNHQMCRRIKGKEQD
jgi:hypothetical protein